MYLYFLFLPNHWSWATSVWISFVKLNYSWIQGIIISQIINIICSTSVTQFCQPKTGSTKAEQKSVTHRSCVFETERKPHLWRLWMASSRFVPVLTESHSWAQALWCFESVYQTSKARTVEQASFERTEAETCGTGGDEKKRVRESALDREQ